VSFVSSGVELCADKSLGGVVGTFLGQQAVVADEELGRDAASRDA
jgi:hypothetical protein